MFRIDEYRPRKILAQLQRDASQSLDDYCPRGMGKFPRPLCGTGFAILRAGRGDRGSHTVVLGCRGLGFEACFFVLSATLVHEAIGRPRSSRR